MDGDPLRDALGSAASRLDVDVEGALEQVGARAGRRRRRQRRVASATVVVGAVVVIAVVLAVAGRGPNTSSPSITASTDGSVPAHVVYGSLPSRDGAAIAYDQARGQVVLFGGSDGSHDHSDTWLWDGHGWSQAHPAVVPPARERAAMAYDPETKELVLFGGIVQRYHQSTLALDDMWTWNGTSWTPRHPAHVPPWSNGLAMSYDPRSKSVLLLTLPSSHPNLDLTPDGVGSRGDTPFGTWQWSGSDWRELPTPSAPLFAKGAVFHGNPRLTPLPHGAGLLFYSWSVYTGSCPAGGANCGSPADPTGTLDAQTFTWDGTRWTEQHPTVAPSRGQLLATPGADGAPTLFAPDGATWTWTGSDWKVSGHQAGPSDEGLAVYDDADSDVVAYAGRLGTDGAFYDTWTWNGSWTKRTASTAPVTTPTTSPTTATSSPSIGPCTPEQLHLALVLELQSVMQQPAAFFSLTNTSVTFCTIDGYPTLTLFDASGQVIPLDLRHDSAYQINDPGARGVVVKPGATVYFGFGWTDANQADGGSQKGCVTIASVRALVPGTHTSLHAAAHLNSVFCPTYGAVTAIAPRTAFTGNSSP